MIRLNKYIADSGLCSRRQADALIESGKVQVNGTVVNTLGTQIDPDTDKVFVEGKPLPKVTRKSYLLFHKPKGVITTRSDEKGRKTIYDWIPKRFHSLDPAGRLDRQSTGALILTDDGDFLYRLTHPGFHVEKRYEVWVDKPFTEQALNQLTEGVLLEPEAVLAKVERYTRLGPNGVELILITGFNRQIRRSLEALGYDVKILKRLSIGPVELADLPLGKTRPLTETERNQLLGKPAKKNAAKEFKSVPSPRLTKPKNGQKTGQQKNRQVENKHQNRAHRQRKHDS